MKKSTYLVLTFLLVVAASCKKNTKTGVIKANGTIHQQGITTYQYGTHILTDSSGEKVYALQSDMLTLDSYLNVYVEIEGNKIKGYPVDGGPEYLKVSKIKE